MKERYKIIYQGGEGEIVEKKSRFIAEIRPVESEEEATAFIAEVKKKYWDARHHCSAFTIGENNEVARCSDDGEPAQTAGRPMLDVLLGRELHNVCAVVTRYFGGVLLGTGGLVRAYTTATARALENAEVVTVRSVVELEVTVDYALYERAALLIHAAGAKLADPQFTDRVTLHWQMPEGTEPPLLEQLRELTRGGAEVSVSQPFYAPF